MTAGGGGGRIVFGADLVDVCIASFPCDILWTSAQILTKQKMTKK